MDKENDNNLVIVYYKDNETERYENVLKTNIGKNLLYISKLGTEYFISMDSIRKIKIKSM